MNKAEIDQKVRKSLPFTHRWHNRFHLEMPFGLINDPNGLIFYKNEYHIFYQWNPLGCEHKNKSWGHVRTRDFIHYTRPELALWPTDAHDKDGCYSGCAYAAESLRVIYTGNAKDAEGNRSSCQRLGTLLPDGTIQKDAIIIPGPPPGYTAHFRDPYRFRRGNKSYLVLGAQTADKRGCVLLYGEQADGWQFLGELATRLGHFGYMWECPNMLQFGDHDVLLFCPQGIKEEDYKYQNLYQCGYITGHFSPSAKELLHGRFHELDKGFDFYAPQVCRHEGRNILVGWMGMPDRDEEYPTAECGWQYTLTMPRSLTLRQGQIYAQPARELEALRIEDTTQELSAQQERRISASLPEGAEILLDIDLGEINELHFDLLYGLEKIRLTYDRKTQVMTIDRRGMKYGGHGQRSFRLFAEDHLALHLFVDKTAIEAFFQHGEKTASFLVFPEKNILPELFIEADSPMENLTGQIWQLDNIKFNR